MRFTKQLDEVVWTDVCQLLRNPELLRNEYERRLESPPDADSQNSLQKQVTAAQRAVDPLIDACTDGLVDRDEFESRISPLRARSTKFQKQLAALKVETRERTALREALACLDSFAETIESHLESAIWATRREILRTLIERMLIETDQIRIAYRINFPFLPRTLAKQAMATFCTFVGGAW